MNCWSIFALFFGPFIGFIFGLVSFRLSERFRRLTAVTSELARVDDLIRGYIDNPGTSSLDLIHAESKKTLEPPVHAALPLLGEERQNQARKVWRGYSQTDLPSLRDDDLVNRVGIYLGSEVKSKEEFLQLSLHSMRKSFHTFFGL